MAAVGRALPESTWAEARELAARYPQPRSALLPMLHLVQSEQGYVSPQGIELCAEVLGLTPAEVSAVSTFYTMYKRRPVGKHHIGVCVNTMCAVLGGDALWDAVSERLGIGHDEAHPDGVFSAERIECQAACTHGPVMTVDWEFFDNMTAAEAMEVIDRLERGEEVVPSRGATIRSFQANERTLAGFDDGLADEGPAADDLMLAGLRRAQDLGHTAPDPGPQGRI
jgi:NADH-quinone oxidoreductase subunit E